MLRQQTMPSECGDDVSVKTSVGWISQNDIACWQIVQELTQFYRPGRRGLVMRTSRAAGDDVSDSAAFVGHVLHVNRVARLPVATAEVGISSADRPLDFHDKAINVENDTVTVVLGWIVRILQEVLQLSQFSNAWRLNIPTPLHTNNLIPYCP